MKSQFSENSAESLASRCRELEKMARVSLDDVLNKATQEVAELLEASLSGNEKETEKEAWDALLNVLSASAGALGSANSPLSYESGSGSCESKNESGASPASLLLKLGAWNSKIWSFRGKYSRSRASAEEVRAATGDLVSEILSFVPLCDPVSLLEKTVEKFESRYGAYLPKIDLRDFVDAHPDFPKPGILFRDVSPMLASPEAMEAVTHEIAALCGDAEAIVGLDARGFLFWMAAARHLWIPFVMARKKGKLPGETIFAEYGLEYWKDVLEVQKYAKMDGKRVAIVDDLLATGGTALAAAELVERAWGKVESVAFAISLDGLASMPGRLELEAKYRVGSVLSYE